MLLTAVLKFNAPETGAKYREIARCYGRLMWMLWMKAPSSGRHRRYPKLADDGIPKSLAAGVNAKIFHSSLNLLSTT